MLRALTLVDILNQLTQDSGEIIPFNANEVINNLASVTEGMVLGSEVWTTGTETDYPANLITDVGPINYWRLDDALSATTTYDSNPWGGIGSLPRLPGTVNGTLTFQVAGPFNGTKCATFNGTTGYVEWANNTSLQRVNDFSIEMWFRCTSLAAVRTLISKGTTGEYHLRLNTNGSIDYLQGPAFSATVVPAATISANTWYHLVLSRRSVDKTINCYVNGVSKFSGTYTTTPSTTTNVLRLGATSPGAAANFFPGQMDEVALYARPLTVTQALNHYNWGQAADVTSNPYGTGQYGLLQYPLPGAVSGAQYGDSATKYGTAIYA